MSGKRTYLDYNASAPLRAEAREAMVAALDKCGNPSSVHAEGRAARAIIETAREQVAALAGAKPSEVVFTSGATEANNWVMAGGWDTVFLSDVEHPSIFAPATERVGRIVTLGVDATGVARVAELPGAIAKTGDAGKAIVALQLSNNETGVCQPVAEMAAIAREHGLFMHCDAVQAAGRVGIDLAELDVDTLCLASHKMGGPKGVGALIVREGAALPASIIGGGQELRRRAGTENVAAIAGFGVAAEASVRDLARVDELRKLRDGLERAVLEITPQAVVIGQDGPRMSNTTFVSVPGNAAGTLVIQFDMAGIALSSGSACSSGKVARSRVLSAMGVADDVAASTLRISLGYGTTARDCDALVAAWKQIFAPRERKGHEIETAVGTGGPLRDKSGVH